ncbi:MAG: prepilin-type N-terminal cleavage/methylation domain-containing protein [Candidatus Omnitrophica bacterium]|nr:prepilin-type N-terminal cleavage/methylation domain-containing protein [Candidatus Omnitrophota bacterium]
MKKKVFSLTGFTPLECNLPQKNIYAKKDIHDVIVGKKYLLKGRSLTGFTLIEFILVLVIIGIVGAVGIRGMGDSVEVSKYKATVKEMKQIKKALVGDENAVEGKQRVDFGYVGDNGSWPAALSNISSYFRANTDYDKDAWGRDYVYADAAGLITVTSRGRDGLDGAASGDPFDEDIVLTINKLLYTNNIVRIMVYDIKGNLLRGNDTQSNYQITSVTLSGGAAAYSAGIFSVTGVDVGTHPVVVTVQDNSGSGGTNWKNCLNEGNTTFSQDIVVYPKGASRVHVVVMRLPGALNALEI